MTTTKSPSGLELLKTKLTSRKWLGLVGTWIYLIESNLPPEWKAAVGAAVTAITTVAEAYLDAKRGRA